jgi:transposase InsO family protein
VPVVRYEHDGPGEMLHIDIKKLGRFCRAGQRLTGDRKQGSGGAGWEFVHVCIDDYSRVADAAVLPNEREERAVAFRRQTNGKAKRFVQTLLREWAYARIYVTSNQRMAVLPIFVTHYNQHRNHGSSGNKPPITRMLGVYNVAGIHS